ncbi:uncharacterized protein G2W53_028947 [Senna tora]|uniref:Uncharacterized protein n=1 Tax=Senna tora TaxID=362788 RepID=A0A834T4C6_9FABA|nr:uncharacterized protein G2W53_028947 [Senna tora]
MAFHLASTTPNLTTRERSARSWNHSQAAASQMTKTELFKNIPGRFSTALKTLSSVSKSMCDSIPPGKKKAIVTMLDINPSKSLRIVEGNQLKQEVVSGIRSSIEFPIPSLQERSTLLPKNYASKPMDWQGIDTPEISNPRNKASRPGDWQGIETLELLYPRIHATRPGAC